MRSRSWILFAAVALGAAGCGKGETADLPKNPVPMQKPGQVVVTRNANGAPQATVKPQPLPK